MDVKGQEAVFEVVGSNVTALVRIQIRPSKVPIIMTQNLDEFHPPSGFIIPDNFMEILNKRFDGCQFNMIELKDCKFRKEWY